MCALIMYLAKFLKGSVVLTVVFPVPSMVPTTKIGTQ